MNLWTDDFTFRAQEVFIKLTWEEKAYAQYLGRSFILLINSGFG